MRDFLVWHRDEALCLISKRSCAPEEESLGGQGTQGGIHKVDVGERSIIVALFAQYLAAVGCFWTRGNYSASQCTHDRMGESFEDDLPVLAGSVEEPVMKEKALVEFFAIEHPAVKSAALG